MVATTEILFCELFSNPSHEIQGIEACQVELSLWLCLATHISYMSLSTNFEAFDMVMCCWNQCLLSTYVPSDFCSLSQGPVCCFLPDMTSWELDMRLWRAFWTDLPALKVCSGAFSAVLNWWMCSAFKALRSGWRFMSVATVFSAYRMGFSIMIELGMRCSIPLISRVLSEN